jgi:hypothetical protein
MSAAHLANIRSLTCVRCGMYGPDPHHLMRGVPVGERGTSRRAADRYSIPVCRACHRWVERTGNDEDQLASIGIDGMALANALWRERDSLEAMKRIVFRTWQTSRQSARRERP